MPNWIIFVMQMLVLAFLIGIVVMNSRTYHNLKVSNDMILRYRRELDWLVARIESLENAGKKNGRQGSP